MTEINLTRFEAVFSLLGENTYTKLNALIVSIIDPNPCKIQFYAWYNIPDFNPVYSGNFYLAGSSQQQKIQKFQLNSMNSPEKFYSNLTAITAVCIA
jgi:hypothetical protein